MKPAPRLSLFDDLPAPPVTCDQAHAWVKTVTIWPGETWERLTWTCTRCGVIRGRC
jgi:hypothetical protein